jgi:hypothetical protein
LEIPARTVQSRCHSLSGRWLVKRAWAIADLLAVLWLTVASQGLAQERLEILPLRPFNVDIALRQAFTPNDREIALQAGLTALTYGNFELGATYQYFSLASHDLKADVHSVYANPRWNNFLDILDFPSGKPINRMLRHLLFGPLEDRAVPFVGLIGGAVLAGPGSRAPTYLYGGDVGVRFPVGHSIALEFTLGYFIYGLNFEGQGGNEQQLLFTTGFFF